MSTAALQSGMTPGVYPHTRTQCASSMDIPESAQLIRQLEEERAKNRQLSTKNQRFEELLRVKDEQLMVQGKQLIVQSKRLVSQDEQLRAKDEPIKRLPEQTASPAKTRKKTKRKRAGQKELKIRNCTIAAATTEITLTYDRLPTVSEVMEKTTLTRQQIYGSPLYKEGRIARASAVATEAMTGSSVQKSEFFSETSEEHCRRKNRSKADQVEIDALADQQSTDDKSNFVTI